MTLLYRAACTYATEGKLQHNLFTNDGGSFRLNASMAYSYEMLVKLLFPNSINEYWFPACILELWKWVFYSALRIRASWDLFK